MSDHKTRNIALKKADIDVGIIPVVRWLNSHPDIHTLHSCQGGPEGYEHLEIPYTAPPYVLWLSQNTFATMMVLETLQKFGVITEITYRHEQGIRYYSKFTKDNLWELMEWLTECEDADKKPNAKEKP